MFTEKLVVFALSLVKLVKFSLNGTIIFIFTEKSVVFVLSLVNWVIFWLNQSVVHVFTKKIVGFSLPLARKKDHSCWNPSTLTRKKRNSDNSWKTSNFYWYGIKKDVNRNIHIPSSPIQQSCFFKEVRYLILASS